MIEDFSHLMEVLDDANEGNGRENQVHNGNPHHVIPRIVVDCSANEPLHVECHKHEAARLKVETLCYVPNE